MNRERMNRRDALKLLGLTAVTASAFPAGWIRGEEKGARKILYFTKSVSFQHSVVARKGDALSHSEKIFTDLGKKHGFEVTCTKDGGVFDGDISGYDAFVFYTAGNLFEVGKEDKAPAMSPKGKEALLAAVKGGKGFVGLHAATDSFHSKGKSFATQTDVDPYIAMLGGEFIRHGEQQKATLRVTSPSFPGIKEQGKQTFEFLEEWYGLKNFAPDLHVILVQETKGMRNPDYQRPPFPQTWARMQGKGRVYYNSLGHREDVWTNEVFQKMLLGGLSWVTGNVSAEIPANLKEAAPGAGTIPPEK
jgi:type 1 glutamine amidotransferase